MQWKGKLPVRGSFQFYVRDPDTDGSLAPTTTASANNPVTTTSPETTVQPRSSDDVSNATNTTHLRAKPKSSAATLDDGGYLPLPVIVLSTVTGFILVGIIIFALYARQLKRRAVASQQPVVVPVMASQDSTATTPRQNIQVL
ncbi:hypothetical protein H310_06974 [Aphanomyces invadans]|uniref:Uncharacterized protein n=1 Tax=Aphanomyces invadans TaxID=157072 RepID=A0A024U5I0_9STRA|nr:hypothetical protein H310_06974 [Aphanomyces invadans]ETW01460.1 hypothetical protein H310_06974 [Aphanomyces invadans]|eukprot:XP_008870458.1 hypothetical protein H310_06974 [Aphanomyces invadans]